MSWSRVQNASAMCTYNKNNDESLRELSRHSNGIDAALLALNDGKGASQGGIKNHMEDAGSYMSFFPRESQVFLYALNKAVVEGGIIQTNNDFYKLSPQRKEKAAERAREAARKKAMQLAKEKSANSRNECAKELIKYLDERVTEDKKGSKCLAEIGSRLRLLLPQDSLIIVPMVDSPWFGNNNSTGLKGMDKKFQDAIHEATEGGWAVLSVETSRVDTFYGDHNDDYEGDVKVEAIYDCNNGMKLNKKIFEKMCIIWKQEWDDGMVSSYDSRPHEIWDDGDEVFVQCEQCGYETSCDDDGHWPEYESTHHECFLVAMLKGLVPKPNSATAASATKKRKMILPFPELALIYDRSNRITLDVCKLTQSASLNKTSFGEMLGKAMEIWHAEKRISISIKIPTSLSHLISAATQYGFDFQYAKPGHCVFIKRLV
eukprot:CAMPEP_0183719622 /NCGR_PEP_ID=MMETSP0737-20130205/12475_1 /TAXON_ID=385413 /ORGANISM="Thalassiosira miniscula, Strain CCMP1093" /LENGTH=430 /DNA_ID=CAMNT_0025949345 /DNA_START=96 /DNA_END=1388 /DNA_ORIENTATION=+